MTGMEVGKCVIYWEGSGGKQGFVLLGANVSINLLPTTPLTRMKGG